MENFNYKLMYDYVVVKPDPTQKMDGGLYLPVTAQQKSVKGTVVGIGRGITAIDTGVFIPTYVKVGDRVLFNKFEMNEFEGNLIGKEPSIIAIIAIIEP